VALGTSAAYVANQGSNTVSVIDLTNDTVAATIPVGAMPNALALSADGSRLYVSNFKDGTESIISTSTNTVTNTVTVGKNPTGVVEAGGLVYVANLLSVSISVIDPSAGTVVRTIALPARFAPSGLAASANGDTLYANDARNGRTYAIDLTQSPPVVEPGFAAVGVHPAYLSVAGSTGYVANPGSNSVSVLDLSQSPLATSATVTVGSSPFGVAAVPSLKQVFATNSGSNNVSVIDTSAAPTVDSTVGVGSVPVAVAVSPDHQTAVISNEGSDNVSIFHVNQPPVNTVPGAQTVTYNATASAHNQLAFSGTISTSDVDAGSSPVQVTLGVAHGTLTLGSTSNLSGLAGNGTGTVSFTGSVSDVNNALNGLVYEPAAPYTGPDSLGLTVDDQGNTGLGTPQSASSAIPITVQNSAPTDIALSNSSADENKPSGTTVGTFSTTDPDPGDAFTYSLVSGAGSTDNSSFQIVGSTLETNATFDFETKSSYSIRVRSTDAGGQSFEKQFTITINDVNDAPTDISLSNSSIDENVAAPATIGTLTASDQDAGQTHTFTLQGSGCGGGPFPDNGSFAISGTNTLQSAVSFDFETKSSYTICIRTTDSGSPALSFDKQFTITINDVNDPPLAVADTYNDPVGNTLAVISTSPPGPQVSLTAADAQTGNTLIANDTDQDNQNNGIFAHPLSAVAETVTTAHGGTATINSDGSFTFLPKAGDRNSTDSFTYHVTDGSLTTAGTVNIKIGGTLVWYVNNALGSNGDGRSSSPFNSLSGINGAGGAGDADSSGDILFLYQGSGNYTGGLPLEANQQLIGQPQGLTIGGDTIVPAGGSNPTITNSGGAAITLADGNTIQRVNASGASGAGVSGSGINTFTYGASTAISGNTGGGLVLSGGGNGTINVGAAITQSNAPGRSVSISGRTGGTTTLSGTINDTAAGITLSGNSGATITLTGTITNSTGGNPAFTATGGGTINATGSGSTLTTSTGTALNVASTTIGSSGLTFQSISANGATNGIVLNSTGASGGLTVSGNSGTCTSTASTCTGGTIQNTSGHGILLTSTQSPSFNFMKITNIATSGIYGTGVTNFTLNNSVIDGVNTSHTATDSDVAFDQNGGTATENNLSGAVSITNNHLNNSYQFGIDIYNYSGTISNIAVTGNSFTSSADPNLSKASAIDLYANRSASNHASIAAGSISSNTIQNFPSGAGIQVLGGNISSGQTVTIASSASPLVIQDNTITGAGTCAPVPNPCTVGTQLLGTNGIAVTAGESTSAFFTIGQSGHPNTITNVGGNGVACSLFGVGTEKCSIASNVINAHNYAGSSAINTGADQATASGASGVGTLYLDIHNNNVSNSAGNGILSTVRSVSSNGIFHIESNTVAQSPTASGTVYGIRVDSGNYNGTGTPNSPTVCLKIDDNTTAGSTNGSLTAPGIGLRQAHVTGGIGTFNIDGLTPNDPSNDAQMEAYVGNQGQNPGSANGTFGATGVASISGGATYHKATCTIP
jgi:YVTN family beta-propeller protein